jgi:hypothetical protein
MEARTTPRQHASINTLATTIIPTANHVFMAATDDRMAQFRLYTDPTIPIVPELTPAIADWIKRLK